MQFYSDYSSDEDDNNGRRYFDPSELLEGIKKADDGSKLKLKRELFDKLLEHPPSLDYQLRQFLLEEGNVELLMSYVSRLDEVEIKEDASRKPKVRSLNPSNNEELVRKSYNVMELFLNPVNDLEALIHEKLTPLMRELFKVFQPNSVGNFHHFSKVLEQLLVRAPVETTHTLVTEELLWKTLDFLHESPVVDTLISIFCCGFPKQSDTIQFYKSLVDNKVFDRIGEKLYNKGQIAAPHVADFFVKLLEKLSSFEMSGILFISLCRSSVFVDGLFKVATSTEDSYPTSQKQACAHVLRELLIKSGEKIFEQADFSRPMPNMLSAVHDKLHDHSKAHIVPLCEALVHMDNQRKENSIPFSAYTIRRAFGLYKFYLVEILTDIIICAPEVLDKLPGQVWKVLGNWFVEYSHNNLYHSMFYKIIQMIVRENHVESQKNLLKNYKFLTQIINHYKAPELTDARGFILLICNTFRLGADLQQPSDFMRQYLQSHDSWKQFLPTLRHDTQLQLKRYSDITNDMLEEEGDEEEELNIDLGSAYARSLGFEEDAPPVPEAPSTPKKKKRKSKKKKNKKKNSSSSSEGDTSSEDENHTGKKEEELTVGLNRESEDDITDPSLSKESWWADLKDEFSKTDELKKEESADGSDWWSDLKSELQNIEQEPNKQ